MLNVTELRKIFTVQGVKGSSKWKREDFNSAIIAAEFAAYAEVETRETLVKVTETKRGFCTECGRKEDFQASGLCTACREYAEWENSHSDEGHEDDTVLADGCAVCHPELDPRKPRREGRSRAGMVIVAKGTEIHKSLLFKREAEAIGWTVEISKETYELAADAEGEGTRHYATATRGTDSISLAWDGRAYDYPASSARLAGKDRKVRNLKEALRLIAA
jgi:hypothetical protein